MTETNTENIDVVAAAAVPAPNQTSRSEDVELTIRSAYQAENDLVFSCPISWSVKQVKEHVKNCLETHPAVSTQRLIFAGAPLRDEQILSNILNERSYVAGEQIFIHLMIAQPYVNDTASEVRRRNVTTASSAAQAPTLQSMHNIGMTPEYSQNMAAWAHYWAAYNQLPPESQLEENQRLMSHYYSYATSAGIASVQSTPSAVAAPVEPPNMLAVWRARLQGQPIPVAAGAAAAPANPANNNPGRVDFLEVGYRVFKLVLLFSAILLYSSFERFALVLCAALFIYFIQLRRNHARNRARTQEQAAAAAAAQPGNQEPHVNNNNNGENDGENNTTPPTENGETLPAAPDASSAPAPPAVEQPSGMQVFLATVYSFVTSFFASLVPDHPMPMDLN